MSFYWKCQNIIDWRQVKVLQQWLGLPTILTKGIIKYSEKNFTKLCNKVYFNIFKWVLLDGTYFSYILQVILIFC